MKWEKRGHVFVPDGSLPWAAHSALTPVPISIRDGEIRVYAGFRDAAGVSRIGFVDVRADDPSVVCRVSALPALDIGTRHVRRQRRDPGRCAPGRRGVADVLRRLPARRQRQVPGLHGLATSQDGDSFARVSRAPSSIGPTVSVHQRDPYRAA